MCQSRSLLGCLVLVVGVAAVSCGAGKSASTYELHAEPAAEALPQLPRARSASGLKESLIPGAATLLRGSGALEAEAGLALAPDGNTLAWAMYGYDPGLRKPDSVSFLLDIQPGANAWLALPDYALGRWEWHGPYTSSKTLPVDEARYLSPSGQLYCLVSNSGEAALTVTALSMRTWSQLNSEPLASLLADQTEGIAPLSVQFDASASLDEDGAISYYLWDCDGDGTYDATSFQPQLSHVYAQAGSFQAAVAVVDNEGAHGISSVQIEVSEPDPIPDPINLSPLAAFSSDRSTALAPFSISFDASASSDPDGTIVKYEWDFEGDGSIDAYGPAPQVSHSYYLRGVYHPTLQVTDNEGAVATAQLLLTLPSEWAVFGLNLHHTRQSSYSGAPTKDLKWSYATGDDVFSSPAIGADGTVYIGSKDRKLHAINPDGSQKWTFDTNGFIYSSPSIGSDGTIYVGSDDYNMYAINADGSLKWKFPTGNWVFSSATIDADGTLYFGSLDNHLYAVNPDGSLLWSFLAGGWVRSTPAIGDDGSIYFGCYDYNFYALKPDGSLKWIFPTGKGIYDSPAIGADGTVYFGSFDDNLYALNPDGTMKWAFPMNDNISCSPSIASDGTVYVGGWDTNMYAINPDGSLKWSFPTGNWVVSSPAIGADGVIYFGSADHRFYALKPNGNLKWKYITGNWVRSSPAIAADGTVYVGSEDGNLYAFGS